MSVGITGAHGLRCGHRRHQHCLWNPRRPWSRMIEIITMVAATLQLKRTATQHSCMLTPTKTCLQSYEKNQIWEKPKSWKWKKLDTEQHPDRVTTKMYLSWKTKISSHSWQTTCVRSHPLQWYINIFQKNCSVSFRKMLVNLDMLTARDEIWYDSLEIASTQKWWLYFVVKSGLLMVLMDKLLQKLCRYGTDFTRISHWNSLDWDSCHRNFFYWDFCRILEYCLLKQEISSRQIRKKVRRSFIMNRTSNLNCETRQKSFQRKTVWFWSFRKWRVYFWSGCKCHIRCRPYGARTCVLLGNGFWVHWLFASRRRSVTCLSNPRVMTANHFVWSHLNKLLCTSMPHRPYCNEICASWMDPKMVWL